MPSRRATALLVVGLLLIPGPVYAAAVDSVGTDRVSSGYSAERIDLDDPDTRTELVERFYWRVTVLPSHVADGPTNRYNAPNRTAAVLRRAYRTNDSVRVTDDAVQADLALLAAEVDFVALDADNGPRRFVVDRSDDAATVSITPVPTAVLFEAVRDETVVHYASLPPAEQDTVDRVLNTTGDEDAYYRPYEDEPHPFPAVVEKDGKHYLVRSVITVDDFDPTGLYVGLASSGIGAVCLLAGGVVTLVGRFGTE